MSNSIKGDSLEGIKESTGTVQAVTESIKETTETVQAVTESIKETTNDVAECTESVKNTSESIKRSITSLHLSNQRFTESLAKLQALTKTTQEMNALVEDDLRARYWFAPNEAYRVLHTLASNMDTTGVELGIVRVDGKLLIVVGLLKEGFEEKASLVKSLTHDSSIPVSIREATPSTT
jgi:hypothetical protein